MLAACKWQIQVHCAQSEAVKAKYLMRDAAPSASPNQAKASWLPDFYSGATESFGRFTEGFLLRRLQRAIEALE